MQRVKSVFLISLFLFLALGGAGYGFLIFSLKPEDVRKRLVENLETLTEGEIHFQDFSLSRFPQPEVELRGVDFVPRSGVPVSFQMERLSIRLSLLGLLLGKAESARIEGSGGNLEADAPAFLPIRKCRVESFHFIVFGAFRPAKPVRFEAEADLGKISKSFRGKGSFTVQDFKKWDWEKLALEVQFQVKDLGLAALAGRFSETGFFTLISGHVTGPGSLRKEAGDKWLTVAGSPKFLQVVYELRREANRLASPVMNLDLDFELAWNADGEEIDVKKAALVTPIGPFEARGHYSLGTGELKEGRLTATGIALEAIPQYALVLRDALPFNFGFSGRSDLDMSVEGALDHLALHANWDLSPALLSYAKVFSKAKDVSMSIVFDALLKNQKLLSGDFSLTLKDAMIKGTLTSLDFETGQGDLTVITNKIQLAGWEKLLLPFEPFEIRGEAKVLANLAGNFLQKPDMVKNVVNLTIENGAISRNGQELGNINVALDLGPVAFEFNRLEWSCGRSQIAAKAVIFNPFQEPNADIRGIAPELVPAEHFEILRALFSDWLPEKANGILSDLENASRSLLPEDGMLENVEVAVKYRGKENQWVFENVDFDVYGGHIQSRGSLDLAVEPGAYEWTSEVEHLSLEQFFAAREESQKIVEGDFSGDLELKGRGWDRQGGPEKLKGRGNFLISGGVFHGFDLLAAVSKINGFSSLEKEASGRTSFEEIQSKFTLSKDRITTKKMVLVAPEFSALGNGDISLGGILNYRWDVFLSKPLADPILAPAKEGSLPGYEQFGPIPILFAGPLERPELEPDPSRLARLQEGLDKKNQDFFRDFLTEDFLARRPTNS